MSAATGLPNIPRTIAACPSIFCEISSLESFKAVPFSRARHCALRRRASLGAVGVDANRSFHRRSRKMSDAPISDIKRMESNVAPQSAIHARQANLVTLFSDSPLRAQLPVPDLQTQTEAPDTKDYMLRNLLCDGRVRYGCQSGHGKVLSS